MPSHPKVVELVDAWGWEEYGSQNSNWEATHFWENVFLNSWESKLLKMHAHSIVHPSVWLSHVLGSSCAFPFTVLVDFSIFPMVGNSFWVLLNVCAAGKSFFGVVECMCSWRKPVLVLLSEDVAEIYVLGV